MNKNVSATSDKKAYCLQSIGRLTKGGKAYKVKLEKDYYKVLLGLEQFSHGMLFCEGEIGKHPFEVKLVEILEVDVKRGEMTISSEEPLNSPCAIYDLKPYFPCEDAALQEEEEQVELVEKQSLFAQWQEKGGDQRWGESIGKISKVGERHRLQITAGDKEGLETLSQLKYIRVFWWFDRFDKPAYRRAVTCEPPYENAPLTGVFASRSPVRPNPIAMTLCKVMGVVGDEIEVMGLDCLDHTPLIGLMAYGGRKEQVENYRVPQYLAHWPKWKSFEEIEKEDALCLTLSAKELVRKEELVHHIYQRKLEDKELPIRKTEGIKIRGARQNNLKNIDVTIPYQKFTVVTGVSGSGKSSLVFDTLFAESQRRWLEHMSMMQRSSFEQLEKPDVDLIEGLPPAIAISQKTMGRHPRSTVGTMTEINDLLKQIFVKIGIRHCPKCGRALNIMTKEEIIQFLLTTHQSGYALRGYGDKRTLLVLNRNEKIKLEMVSELVEEGLRVGKGALVIAYNGQEVILQTTQMCYGCEVFLFELTPATFSFNQPESMCPQCKGLGVKMVLDPKRIVEKPELSLLDGAISFLGELRKFIACPNANWCKGEIVGLARKMKIDLDKPWHKLPEDFRKKVIWGSEEEVTYAYENTNGRSGAITRKVTGVYHHILRFIEEGKGSSESSQKLMAQYMKQECCPSCKGERLNREGRSVTVQGKRYPELLSLELEALKIWLEQLASQVEEEEWEKIKEDVKAIYHRVNLYIGAGLQYLSLSRSVPTLSGGELQRLKLVKQLQSEMYHTLYVLDEPSMGLSSKDTERIASLVSRLIRRGNTVVAVEHNRQLIEKADYLIDIGPGAGKRGGQLMAVGSPEEMRSQETSLTGQYLSGKKAISMPRKEVDLALGGIKIEGAYANNLKDVSVMIPYGAMTAITGVSGAGKSSLLHGVLSVAAFNKEEKVACKAIRGLEAFSQIIEVSQQPIGKSPRSNPLTYMGGMDEIRNLFAATPEAKEKKITAKMFSFNNKEGSCNHCGGLGKVDLSASFMPDTWVNCPICKGKRYKKEVLAICYQGKNIDDILHMTVQEAASFFSKSPKLLSLFRLMEEVGLGYLELGQSATTLSGGEAQRLKLSKQLGSAKEGKKLYLLDEPTTGLHFEDIERLLMVLRKLTEEGHTVIMIEHQLEMIANCDWQIELGPEGGNKGGYLIYQGVPRQ